jgi:hypothetical protein
LEVLLPLPWLKSFYLFPKTSRLQSENPKQQMLTLIHLARPGGKQSICWAYQKCLKNEHEWASVWVYSAWHLDGLASFTICLFCFLIHYFTYLVTILLILLFNSVRLTKHQRQTIWGRSQSGGITDQADCLRGSKRAAGL